MHFKSNHPRSVKIGVASCLLQRAETHCNEEQEKKQEVAHVKSTLKNNGYLKNVFGDVATQHQPPRMAVTTLMRTHRRPTALALMSSAPIGRPELYIRLVKADLTNADSRK
jgi:hypothetical protein